MKVIYGLSLALLAFTVVYAGAGPSKQDADYDEVWLRTEIRLSGQVAGKRLTRTQADSLLALPRMPVVHKERPIILDKPFLWHNEDYTRVIVFRGVNDSVGEEIYDVRGKKE